jgi:putative transposase
MSSRVVKRAYRYRFYPTPDQAGLLNRTFGSVRYVYNRALAERSRAWTQEQRRVTFADTCRDGRVALAKMSEPLDIRWSRPLPEGAEPSTVTVSRDSAGRWHISILTECPVSALPPLERAVGIDAGITTLMTLSTGEKVANPRHERRDRLRLRKAQRNLSRKAKGSANRAKARVQVARVHARIADRRRDHLHKLSTRIIRENQAVIIEDLAVRNMVANHTLARAISDASWGAAHDRDVNAAKVLRAAGLAVLACGDGVRPPRT